MLLLPIQVLLAVISIARAQEVIFTETLTESRDFATSTSTTVKATKTVYLIPQKQRPWWTSSTTDDPLYPTRELEAETVVDTEYIRVTVTASQSTVAPTTVTHPLTVTETKVELHWKSVPVEIKYYQTITETTTARPLIADLLPKFIAAPQTTTVYSDAPPYQMMDRENPRFHHQYEGYMRPMNIPMDRMPLAGEMARNLEYHGATTPIPMSTATTTVVSTITPPVDWKEGRPATMNACDLCRQQCVNLQSNCCINECAQQPPTPTQAQLQPMPIVVPIPPPVPPINPDAIPCDDNDLLH